MKFDINATVPSYRIGILKNQFREFEAIFLAEIKMAGIYYVSPKGGFDPGILTDHGDQLFLADLFEKVTDALLDLKAAARCIAFDLPNAAGFHLHRANEAVLRKYWDHVAGGLKRPVRGSMGSYLDRLEKLDKGKREVREHLKSIKNLHRNPLMHPDHSIDTIDEAIDLLAAIRCSIGYMLREIK